FALDPFVPEPWKRGLIVVVFAALVPFTTVAAARTVPWRGGATAVLASATVSFYVVAGLMGSVDFEIAALPLIFAGIAIFLLPGVVADLVVTRPWRESNLMVAVALVGTVGGLLSLLQEGPALNMTGGLQANPVWFLALYGLGGVLGGLIGLAFANALLVKGAERTPAPAVAD
ncbi:MAG: hypothetical protein R3291_04470, partial [Thermoplasmata archaeon]|nr:hypothetical protein [Thermoplasmata archaeon]